MSIENCLNGAKEKFRNGKIESIRISFITCRTNELMNGMTEDFRDKVMKQANDEADNLNL